MKTSLHRKDRHGFIVLCSSVFLFFPGPVCAETLVTSLSSHRVEISSNYTGTAIVVFGAIEKNEKNISRTGAYDVVVTVRGPRQMTVVREKQRLGFFWINTESQKFPSAPAYLGIFSSRPLEEIGPAALLRQEKIGLSAIVGAPDFSPEREGLDRPFRQALMRLRRQEDLYLEQNRGVSFLAPGIFRATAPLPAISPPGAYDVEVVLFADGAILARHYTGFDLVKSAFEQEVGALAHDAPWLYGLAVATIAILFGFLASVVFRRD